MFTKEEILSRRRKEIFNAEARGEKVKEAGLNLATLILGAALYDKKQWSGEDYAEHPILVGMRNTRSTTKKIIGILHDVVEDSDWTLTDILDCRFSNRVVNGLDGVTKREGELYFDFIERCSLNSDSIDVKINDLEHNSTNTRNVTLLNDRVVEKQNIYIIAYNYLVAVKCNEITAGTPITKFLEMRPLLNPGPAVLAKFSSRIAYAPASPAPAFP